MYTYKLKLSAITGKINNMIDLSENTGIIQHSLIKILEQMPEGISEYELIHKIKDELEIDDNNQLFRDSYKLFTVHFFLFHSLYHLRERLWSEKKWILEITPLKIRLTPWLPVDSTTISDTDHMSDYYMDINNLEQTGKDDVETLLNCFWQRYLSLDEKQHALQVMELKEPVNMNDVSMQYRKLAMKYHPDRGGTTEKIQSINNAMTLLKRYFKT